MDEFAAGKPAETTVEECCTESPPTAGRWGAENSSADETGAENSSADDAGMVKPPVKELETEALAAATSAAAAEVACLVL